MASSEPNSVQTDPRNTIFDRLIASRNRELSLFLPFLIDGSHHPPPYTPNPDNNNDNSTHQQPPSANGSDPPTHSDRIILINPFTQSMVVIEGASLTSLLRTDQEKSARRPASKESIESMPSVEVAEDEEGECVICLEEWNIEGGGIVKEMPCRHRFHGVCIDKWLNIHGSCPVCRYEMPHEEEGDGGKSREGDGHGPSPGPGAEGDDAGRRTERGIWVSFMVGSISNSGGLNPNSSSSEGSSDDSSNVGSSTDQRADGFPSRVDN